MDLFSRTRATALSALLALAGSSYHASQQNTSQQEIETIPCLEKQNNPQVYIIAWSHPETISLGFNQEKDKEAERATENLLKALGEFRKQGIEDILIEGITPEMVAPLQKNPSLYAQDGAQEDRFTEKLFSYLNQVKFKPWGMERAELAPEMREYVIHLQGIRDKYKIILRKEIELSDQKASTVERLVADYTKQMQDKARKYLEGPEGNRLREIAVDEREKGAVDFAKTGRRFVLPIGASHADSLIEKFKKAGIPYALYSHKTKEELIELASKDAFIKAYTPLPFTAEPVYLQR